MWVVSQAFYGTILFLQMSTETRPENLTGYIPESLREKIAGVVLRPASTYVSERIIRHAQIELPEGFLTEYVMAIDSDYAPILVSNHASHADAAVAAKLISLLRKIANRTLPDDEQMMGFNVPLAKSLLTGHQGGYLRQAYLGSEPVIEANGFYAVPIARSQDQDPERYAMPGNEREYLANTRRRMLAGFTGTVLFPEGTTEGGKIREDGKLVGMIPLQRNSISTHISLTHRYAHKKVVIITAGITGGIEAINPNTKRAPFRIIARVRHADAFKITAGGIIKEDDLDFAALKRPEEINDFIGRKIAELLPPPMRGVYA